MISAVGLLFWGAVFYALYLLKVGLGTETGQKFMEAVIERIRGKS